MSRPTRHDSPIESQDANPTDRTPLLASSKQSQPSPPKQTNVTWRTHLALKRDTFLSILTLQFGFLLPRLRVPDAPSLDGKICIVTGANVGIGLEIARALAQRAGEVWLAVRSVEKGERARREILGSLEGKRKGTGPVVRVLELDTSSLASVRAFAVQCEREAAGRELGVVVQNAGIVQPAAGQSAVTDEGLGTVYATNFLGPFALAALLEPLMGERGRMVFTGSTGQYFGDLSSHLSNPRGVPQVKKGFWRDPWGWFHGDKPDYPDTKQMQVAFVRKLQERWLNVDGLAGKRLVAQVFVPGFAATSIFERVVGSGWRWGETAFKMLQRFAYATALSPEQGATTGVWLATSNDEEVASPEKGGRYWDRMRTRLTRVDVEQAKVLEKCWSTWCKDSEVEWKT